MKTLAEHIEAQWAATYDGCDPAVNDNPRAYALGWFRQGFMSGMQSMGRIREQVNATDNERIFETTFNLGHAQGAAFAAFHASQTVSIEPAEFEGMSALQGAELMREKIVEFLQATATGDKIRAEAK